MAKRREREGKAEKEQKLRIKRKGESRVGRVYIDSNSLSCGNMCFAWRKECNKCNQPRGGGGEFYTAGGRGGYARGGGRGGW